MSLGLSPVTNLRFVLIDDHHNSYGFLFDETYRTIAKKNSYWYSESLVKLAGYVTVGNI